MLCFLFGLKQEGSISAPAHGLLAGGYVLDTLLDLGPFEVLVKQFNLLGSRVTELVTSSGLAAEFVGWSFQLIG